MKSKRGLDTAYKQQRLPALRLNLTAGNLYPVYFLIGIIFTAVGIGLWCFSTSVSEKVIPYTNCIAEGSDISCAEVIGNNSMEDGSTIPDCVCKLNFTLEDDLKGKVYIYYELTHFYQNHRRYVKSRDDKQLYGGTGEPSHSCFPYAKDKDGKFIWPCGAIANSKFQDEISLFSMSSGVIQQIKLKRTGIAWASDIAYKFKNPPGWNTPEFRKSHVKPKAWKKSPWELDQDPKTGGLKNEDFIVWKRIAAFPNFRKLYRIVDHKSPGYEKGLGKGEYLLEIKYYFPVVSFKGTKSIVLAPGSRLGTSLLLGICYTSVGCICLVIGAFFMIVRIYSKNKKG